MKANTHGIPPQQDDEKIRSMIEHENDLINHRLTWLTTMQGLLFASLGFAWDKPSSVRLIRLLCGLGVAVSILSLLALILASRATHVLLDWWDTHKPHDYAGPDVIGLRPMFKGRLAKHIADYIKLWNFYPMLFIIAWSLVWIMN